MGDEPIAVRGKREARLNDEGESGALPLQSVARSAQFAVRLTSSFPLPVCCSRLTISAAVLRKLLDDDAPTVALSQRPPPQTSVRPKCPTRCWTRTKRFRTIADQSRRRMFHASRHWGC